MQVIFCLPVFLVAHSFSDFPHGSLRPMDFHEERERPCMGVARVSQTWVLYGGTDPEWHLMCTWRLSVSEKASPLFNSLPLGCSVLMKNVDPGLHPSLRGGKLLEVFCLFFLS